MRLSGRHFTEAEQSELVALLQRLIQFPTEDPPGRELELARFVRDTLAASGFTSNLVEFQPGRANVVARLKGQGERPGLVFSAHLDTLPAGEGTWQFPPFEGHVSDGRVYGRGASDMKGGLAAMMAAAQRLAREDLPLRGDLILAFSAGESSNGLGAKQMVADGSLEGAGALLISEPTTLTIVVAEKGALWLKAIATGMPGHPSGAGGSQGTGENAILKLVSFINRLRDFEPETPAHPLLDEPTIAVNTIAGGSAINLTPDRAELGLDIRYLPGMSAEEIVGDLRAVADSGGLEIAFEILDDKPPVETAPDHPFVRLCQESYRASLGRRPEFSRSEGAQAPLGGASYFSDAAVLCPALDLPRVIIGPGEMGMSGQRDEYVQIERLNAAADIYVEIALDFLLR
ncbi:MAG: M20 family metallopeptidase [Anaerolineae bacterium]